MDTISIPIYIYPDKIYIKLSDKIYIKDIVNMSIDSDRIKLLYCSKSVKFFKDRLLNKFGLTEYNPHNKLHINNPCFFFGIYTLSDLKMIKEHRSYKILIWSGGDAKKLKNRNHPHNSYLKYLKTDNFIKHVAISNFIEHDLLYHKVKPYKIVFSLADPTVFKPVPLGTRVYIYTSKINPENYGKSIYSEVIKRLPEVKFIVAHYNKVQHKDIYDIYKKCFIGLRITSHDGNANTVQELGLCGIRCIHNGEMPNAIAWKNIDDIIESIKNEMKFIGQTNHELADQVKNYLQVNESPDWLHMSYFYNV